MQNKLPQIKEVGKLIINFVIFLINQGSNKDKLVKRVK